MGSIRETERTSNNNPQTKISKIAVERAYSHEAAASNNTPCQAETQLWVACRGGNFLRVMRNVNVLSAIQPFEYFRPLVSIQFKGKDLTFGRFETTARARRNTLSPKNPVNGTAWGSLAARDRGTNYRGAFA